MSRRVTRRTVLKAGAIGIPAVAVCGAGRMYGWRAPGWTAGPNQLIEPGGGRLLTDGPERERPSGHDLFVG